LFVFFEARSDSAEFCYFIKLAFLVVAGRGRPGDRGFVPRIGGQLGRPGLGARRGGSAGCCMRGAGVGAGCWGEGSRLGGGWGGGCGSDASAAAWLGETPTPGCADTVLGSSHLSPLFSQLCQSLLRGEKGGRRESIPLGMAAAQSQGTNPLTLLGRSQPLTPGKGKQTESLYSPVQTLPSSPGSAWKLDFVKVLNHGSPAEAGGSSGRERAGATVADGDLNSSKAISTGAQGGCSTEQLKTAPLPSSSSGGSQQRLGWRWMASPSPIQETCQVVQGVPATPCSRGARPLPRHASSRWPDARV